jgi:hypothetical protein
VICQHITERRGNWTNRKSIHVPVRRIQGRNDELAAAFVSIHPFMTTSMIDLLH